MGDFWYLVKKKKKSQFHIAIKETHERTDDLMSKLEMDKKGFDKPVSP